MLKKILLSPLIWFNESISGPSKRWWILAVVQFSNLLSAIDSSIVNIAIPSISKDTGAGLELTHWVVTAYLITTTVSLLITGRLADIFGRTRIFGAGFILFTAASGLCGIATDCYWLIGGRVLQAIGAASLLANGSAILTETFEGGERGLALGLNSTAVAAGYALGYVAGGVLVQYAGWRSIFFVNLPIGIISMWLCLKVLKADAMSDGPRPSFDLIGAILIILSVGPLLFVFDSVGAKHHIDNLDTALFLIGAVSLVLFIYFQSRCKSPLIDMSLFRIRAFGMGFFCLILFVQVFASISFVLPFYLQGVLKLNASQAGFIMSPYSIIMCFAAPITGWLSAKISAARLATGGFATGIAVTLLYASLGQNDSWWWVVLGQFIMGVAAATFLAPNRVSMLSSVPNENLGIANGLQQSARFLALAIGTTIASIFIENMLSPLGGIQKFFSAGGGNTLIMTAFQSAQFKTFMLMTALLVFGTFVSALNAITPVKKCDNKLTA